MNLNLPNSSDKDRYRVHNALACNYFQMYEEETRKVSDVGDKEMNNQLLQQGESGAEKFK